MTVRDERAAWLALLFGGQVRRPAAKAALLRWCVQGNRSAVELLAQQAPELSTALGVDAQHASAIAAAAQDLDTWLALADDLEARGIATLLRVDPAYPEAWVQRLSEGSAPYVAFARGALELLCEPAVALLGGAKPSEEALQGARQLAGSLAQQGHALVGGDEPGIDRSALDSAREAGGARLLVLGQGLDAPGEQRRAPGTRELLLSPFLPGQERTAALAQARLPLITALCEALVLFDPDGGPNEWPGYPAAHAQGLPTLLHAGAGAATAAWRAAGAFSFGDATEASRILADALGTGAPATPDPTLREAGPEATLYESPRYADADAAIDALRRAGAVPPALARKMRDARWCDADELAPSPNPAPGGKPT